MTSRPATVTAREVTGAPAARRRPPGTLGIGIARTGIELRQFFRERDSMVFTFFFPVIMLFIFGSAFSSSDLPGGVTFTQYFAAGMIASGIVLSSFQQLAISIAVERDDGSLKRLRGTPMPPAAYLLGKVGMVFVVGLAQLAILLTVATRFYDVPMPDASGWLTLAWVFVLGTSACSLLGIAYSAVARSAKSASAVVTLPFLILQFISGVFFPFNELPVRLQEVAALFPLKWMCQGLRSVFLPDSFTANEPAGGWELSTVAVVLAMWSVVGLAFALRTFRWTRREEG